MTWAIHSSAGRSPYELAWFIFEEEEEESLEGHSSVHNLNVMTSEKYKVIRWYGTISLSNQIFLYVYHFGLG